MPGCEADVDAVFPEKWTKWVIPAQTYLTVSASPDKYGEIFKKITSDPNNIITGSVHEYYPVPENPSIMELWFPITEGKQLCQSCHMPMTKPEDFGTEADGKPSCDCCRHCYINGEPLKDVTMDKLTADIQTLIEIEMNHPGLLSAPLLNKIKEWISLENDEAKKAAMPTLFIELVDGQDCDFTGTRWEKEWLADGKVCHCIACVAARKCISDIRIMSKKTELEKVSRETMRFMRGKYALDEIPGRYYDIDCLKFRQGKKTILSINIHDDYYDFQIILGKAEREKFEAWRDEFPNPSFG
jgi:hypothetical protein